MCWKSLTGIKSEAKCLRHTKFQCNSLHKCGAIFAKGVMSVEIKWCFWNVTNVNYLLHQDWFLATINSSDIYRCELQIACALDHVCCHVLTSSPPMYKTNNLKLLHADTVEAYLTNLDYCNITVLPIDEISKVLVVLCEIPRHMNNFLGLTHLLVVNYSLYPLNCSGKFKGKPDFNWCIWRILRVIKVLRVIRRINCDKVCWTLS